MKRVIQEKISSYRDCCVEFHTGHNYESFSRAAQIYSGRIKESLERIRLINKDTSAAIGRLNILSQQIESKYSQVQREINTFIDCYIDALEEHRKGLLKQATKIRKGQIESLRIRQEEVEKNFKNLNHTLRFGDELLNEGSDFEVLSFAFFILQRLEWCIKVGTSALSSAFTNCIGTMQFLPDEHARTVKNRTLYGVVTTQVVSPSHCFIMAKDLEALKNCRKNQRCDLTLVTKDSYDQRLTHGAEGIEIDLRRQNGSCKHIPICVVDQQNGVYLISFTPDTSEKMCLSVSIRGVPIKGSPFPVRVRAESVHEGTFHCCTFCSSGGNKNVVCGCGGRMPGGYQGCGHGYIGHPGGHHWSCCGNTLHKSECLRSLRSDGFYHLKL
ncbi:hypothetical protein RUM43_008604 [Polyplax serrata]|uniref:B-box C-terminal domain-containing protein n=1 Tax=Polyplax serrata TaxID=468196 RepID=A0AAN8NYR1_POLSC